MSRFILTIGFLALVSCGGLSKKDSKKAVLHLKIGTAHLSQGNYPSALSELLQAAKYDPENPVIQNNLALAYFVRGKYALAEQHFRQAVTLEPRYTEARNNWGRTLIELGLYDQAIYQLTKAVNDLTYTVPEKSYANLGIAYFKKGDYKNAITNLKSSLKISRENCIGYNYYGRALYALENYQQAAEAFDQSLPHCKAAKFDEPFYYGALSYFKLGQQEDAMARFEQVISEFPDGNYAQEAKKMVTLIRKARL